MNLNSLKKITIFFTSTGCEFDPGGLSDRMMPYIKTCDMKSFYIIDYHNSKYFNYLKTNVPLSIESSHIDEKFVTFVVNSDCGNIFDGFFDFIFIINPVDLSIDNDHENDIKINGYSFKNYNLFSCPVFHLTYAMNHCNKNRIKTEIMGHIGYNCMSSLAQYL